MGKVAGVLERLQATPGHRGMGQERMLVRDDRVVRAPHEQRRHPSREVAAIEHRDDLAPKVDRRPERADERAARGGVRKRVEDAQEVRGVAASPARFPSALFLL